MTLVDKTITITFNNDESAKYDKELCCILFTTIKNFIDDVQNDEITIPYDKKTFDLLFGGLLCAVNINQTNELTAFLGTTINIDRLQTENIMKSIKNDNLELFKYLEKKSYPIPGNIKELAMCNHAIDIYKYVLEKNIKDTSKPIKYIHHLIMSDDPILRNESIRILNLLTEKKLNKILWNLYNNAKDKKVSEILIEWIIEKYKYTDTIDIEMPTFSYTHKKTMEKLCRFVLTKKTTDLLMRKALYYLICALSTTTKNSDELYELITKYIMTYHDKDTYDESRQYLYTMRGIAHDAIKLIYWNNKDRFDDNIKLLTSLTSCSKYTYKIMKLSINYINMLLLRCHRDSTYDNAIAYCKLLNESTFGGCCKEFGKICMRYENYKYAVIAYELYEQDLEQLTLAKQKLEQQDILDKNPYAGPIIDWD